MLVGLDHRQVPMRRILFASVAALLVMSACSGSASAASRCPAGEVWGDLGCQPKAKSSLMVRAAKRIKSRFHRAKPKPADADRK
jgi:hypothetical protein